MGRDERPTSRQLGHRVPRRDIAPAAATGDRTEPEVILCLNAGSSSIKAAVFRHAGRGDPRRVVEIAAEGIGEDRGTLEWRENGERTSSAERRFIDHSAALEALLDRVQSPDLPQPDAVGHRVVRGPSGQGEHVVLDEPMLARLDALAPVAPLHLPAELATVRACRQRFPSALQIACFDSAFFSRLPAVARRLPLPRAWIERGIERIGYHGLSYEYVVSACEMGNRSVIAHLGNGASMAALSHGRPIDTTMGFTPAGGLMMGTRTGDLDPGALIEIIRREGLGADGLEELVNVRSGLAGVSGGEADMETLLDLRADNVAAAEAVDSFCYSARKQLGAMIAALGGIDLLVFTGGIGENAPGVRAKILDGLADLGLKLDPEANEAGADRVSTADSPAVIRVIPTDEDLVIARQVIRLYAARTPNRSPT